MTAEAPGIRVVAEPARRQKSYEPLHSDACGPPVLPGGTSRSARAADTSNTRYHQIATIRPTDILRHDSSRWEGRQERTSADGTCHEHIRSAVRPAAGSE